MDDKIPQAVVEAIKAFGQAQYDYGHGDWQTRGRGCHVVVQMHTALLAAIAVAIEQARQDGARNLLQEWEP